MGTVTWRKIWHGSTLAAGLWLGACDRSTSAMRATVEQPACTSVRSDIEHVIMNVVRAISDYTEHHGQWPRTVSELVRANRLTPAPTFEIVLTSDSFPSHFEMASFRDTPLVRDRILLYTDFDPKGEQLRCVYAGTAEIEWITEAEFQRRQESYAAAVLSGLGS